MRYTQPVPKSCIWERSSFLPPVLFSCNQYVELPPEKGKLYSLFLAALAWGQSYASDGNQEEQALGSAKAKNII
jgi:hypothetical protein